MTNPIRIGEVLIERGVLTEQQVFEIVQAQKTEHLPFGVLAEQMCDVTLSSIEDAWTEQYHRFTGTIDLTRQRFDPEALALLDRRRAWQFQMLPVGFEPGGELIMAASRERLPRAVTFVAAQLEPVVYFRIAQTAQLRRFLQEYYPMPEISDVMLEHARQYARSA